MISFLVSVAFCFLFISKPLQVISSYNHCDRILDVKLWHVFLKSLPSLSILEKVSSRKRHNIKIKQLFLLTFIARYSNLEVNKIYFWCWSDHLSEAFLIRMTVHLRHGNVWYCCIRLLMSNHLVEKYTVPQENYIKDILCITATNISAQITITQ